MILREYFNKKMLIMLMMSFSSGLPIALVLGTLQMWYTVSNASVVAIGLLTLVGLPYTYKFLWAPFMDRFVPPFLGRRRGWILITQILLLFGILFMSLVSPGEHPLLLASLAIVVAFFSASQDVVLDAYRTDILNQPERGAALAIWANGYRLAMIVSGAVALILAAYVGWHLTYMIMAILMLIGIVTTFLAPEPQIHGEIPKTLKVAIIGAFGEFLRRRYAWLLLLVVILYKLGDAFSLSLASVFFYRTLGFNLVEIAWVFKIFATGAGLAGVLLAGALMARWSLYKSLMVFGWMQALALLSFSVLALVGKNVPMFATSVFLEHFTSGMGTVALLAFITALCDRRFSATHYALLSAVMTIGRTFIGPVAGFSIEFVSWPIFFVIACLLGLVALAILWWLHQRIDFSREKIM
jgi:PAT family beta-lactamase induction signal transducer AmpG